MKEIIKTEPDGQGKCPMCRFEAETLYRFKEEAEDRAICGKCFFESILDQDLDIAGENEIAVSETVTELVGLALAELSAGELDGLEDTLRSLDDQLPENDTSAPITEA